MIAPSSRIEPVKALIGVFLAWAVMMAVFHPISQDELEHLHSAWYIGQGYIPYLDFFEHHHPLLWYLLVPLLWLFGETTTVIIAARFLMLGCLLVLGRIVAGLVARIFHTPAAPLWAVALLYSNVMFVCAGIQLRPDVPEVVLLAAAVLEMVKYEQDGGSRRLYGAALFSSLALVFLQKAVLFFPAAGAAWLLSRYAPGAPSPKLKTLAASAAIFCSPLAIFLALLAVAGTLPDYLACNWMFNTNRGSVFPPLFHFLITFIENPVHYSLFVLLFFWSIVGPWRRRIPLVVPAVIFVFAVTPFLIGSPYTQYFLLPIALAAMLGGGFVAELLPRLVGRRGLAAVLFVGLLLIPMISFGVRLGIGNRAQLELVAHVTQNTGKGERVHDGRANFNVFRHDLHYFWFMPIFERPDAKLPARLEARRADFDIPRLIREFRPAFVSGFGMNVSDPGFAAAYAPEPIMMPGYPGYPDKLYRRLNP